MRNVMRYMTICLLVITMSVTTACAQLIGNNPPEKKQRTETVKKLSKKTEKIGQNDQGASEDYRLQSIIAMLSHKGVSYIPIHEIIAVLEYNNEWDAMTRTYHIGDNDIVYSLTMDSKHAEKAGEAIELQHEPVMMNGSAHITKESFEQLFKGETKYEFRNNELVIIQPYDEAELDDEDLDFADDPNDPNDSDLLDEAVWQTIDPKFSESIPVLKNRDRIIRTARQYLGVKYKFGAKAYPTSKRFDCSSYTQYVFGQHGVKLNRVARSQAKQGVAVSRKSLRKGDLMFFYIPGRFKSNKVVGHVGIYMGNNRMIHAGTSPKNGVQITNINTAYWKRTFLNARRVVR